MIMKRDAEAELKKWFERDTRKPLILRGARQVGKSTLVRNFARDNGIKLYEINLERHLDLKNDFAVMDPERICRAISVYTGGNPSKGDGLLFIDEIQAIPEAVAALRYFYEEMPEVPVISAGSLLEFSLSGAKFPMPVGRIEYMYLGPVTFREFVSAAAPDMLAFLDETGFGTEIPDSAHNRLNELFRTYLFTGGMPESAAEYIENRDALRSGEVLQSILDTYEDDFSKYAQNRDLALMQSVFRRIPVTAGQKTKYVNLSREAPSRDVKAVLDLFKKAQVCSIVYASDCSGIPLYSG